MCARVCVCVHETCGLGVSSFLGRGTVEAFDDLLDDGLAYDLTQLVFRVETFAVRTLENFGNSLHKSICAGFGLGVGVGIVLSSLLRLWLVVVVILLHCLNLERHTLARHRAQVRCEIIVAVLVCLLSRLKRTMVSL